MEVPFESPCLLSVPYIRYLLRKIPCVYRPFVFPLLTSPVFPYLLIPPFN